MLARNRTRAEWLAQGLAPLSRDARLANVRQRGLIWAADLRDGIEVASFAERYHRAALEQGVLVRPIGNTLYVMPPYVFDAGDARWLGERLLAALDATVPDAVTREVGHAA